MSALYSMLDEVSREQPQKPIFVFPETRWNSVETLTYRELAIKASAAASQIAQMAEPGNRALLMFPTGSAFWEAFFGCMGCGVIAVPLKTPNLNRVSDHLSEICRDCSPSVVITDVKTAKLLAGRADLHPELAQLPVITPNQWTNQSAEFSVVRRDNNTIAFLQYTSGSTARPKGVQISHGNLLANMSAICERMQLRPYDEIAVTWLPHYHDMGLVGSYLTTLFTKTTSYCLPPEEFAIHPARLLQLISDHKATVCGGPDFMYRLCTEKTTDEHLQGLDLSSWRVAYVGAERIRAQTLQKFTDKFSPVGFRRLSFFPCYGLGESTLIVTGGPAESEPQIRDVSTTGLMQNEIRQPNSSADCTTLVGSGQMFEPSKVFILDSASQEIVPEETIGEVVVSGPSMTVGYFQRPELNAELFSNVKIGDQVTRCLHTGDLGFLANGELFITGRIKEVMIIRGRNLSPEDLEQQIFTAHDSLVPGGVVAFSAERNGEECVIIAAELKRTAVRDPQPESVFAAIRSRVSTAFGVNPAEIFLLGPATIPRTSSGKPRRLAMRDLYLNGGFEFLLRDGQLLE